MTNTLSTLAYKHRQHAVHLCIAIACAVVVRRSRLVLPDSLSADEPIS